MTDTSGTPPPSGVRKPCPDPEVSLWSRFTFSWVKDMLAQGRREKFSESDVFDLLPGEQSCRVVPRFARAWEREVHKVSGLR
ncbi:hypothetical protein ACOMHN_060662 [Nucella lapillus]